MCVCFGGISCWNTMISFRTVNGEGKIVSGDRLMVREVEGLCYVVGTKHSTT